jgi:hypothetical protein
MKTKGEIDMQSMLLLAAPKVLPRLRLFRRSIAAVRLRDELTEEERFVRFGIAGQCDLYGIEHGGKHIEIELKALGRKRTPKQDAWWSFCMSWRVPYLVLAPRAGETPEQTIDRWLREIEAELRPLSLF